MKNFIVFIWLMIYVVIFPAIAIGQVISEEEIIELINGHILQFNNRSNSDLSFVRQVGDKNRATSIQEQEGVLSNVLIINQDGIENTGYIEQIGAELKTYLWQYNYNNEASLWSVGENIRTTVKQNGEENIINSYIENYGVHLRSASLLQEGNRNRIDLSLKGDGFDSDLAEQAVIINQFGNNHEVKALIEPFSTPIVINQYSGSRREGMRVNISTSTFDFPIKK